MWEGLCPCDKTFQKHFPMTFLLGENINEARGKCRQDNRDRVATSTSVLVTSRKRTLVCS